MESSPERPPSPSGPAPTLPDHHPVAPHIDPAVPDDNASKRLTPFILEINVVIITLAFLAFIVVSAACFVGTIFIPKPYVSNTLRLVPCDDVFESMTDTNTTCTSRSFFNTTTVPLSFLFKNVNALNRELRFGLRFPNPSRTFFGTSLNFTVDIETLNDGVASFIVRDFGLERTITCNQNVPECDPINLFTLISVSAPEYRVSLRLDTSRLFPGHPMDEPILTLGAVSRTYSMIELVWRLVFVLFSCAVVVGFLFMSRKYPQRAWPVENKSTLFLLFWMILENNPIYSYEYLVGASSFIFINTIINTCFYCFVLVYILAIFEALRTPPSARKKLSFWLPRATFFLVFFVVVAVRFLLDRSKTLLDPFYQPTDDISNVGTSIVAVLFACVYVAWLAFSVVRSCSEARKAGNARRVITFGALSLVSVVAFLILVCASYFLGYQNTASFYLGTLAYENFFVALMAVMYIPVPELPHWRRSRTKIVEYELLETEPADPEEDDVFSPPDSSSSD